MSENHFFERIGWFPSPEEMAKLSQQELAKVWRNLQELSVMASEHSLRAFIGLINPNFYFAPHNELIIEKLEAVERGEILRLMLFLPPRSGKSLLVSVYFPVWCLGRNPAWQIICASYGSELAEQFSRDARNICLTDDFAHAFPQFELRQDIRGAKKWGTREGGLYIPVGVTSGVAGRGAHLGILDDLLSENDAYSKAKRDYVTQHWYGGGFLSRLMPGGARIVYVGTRWHSEDLPGFLLKQSETSGVGSWDVVSIPAILDDAGAKLLNLKAGDTYWPPAPNAKELAKKGIHCGWSLNELIAKKNDPGMSPHHWEALYMQRPVPEGGGILKTHYWKRWPQENPPPTCKYVLHSWDTAFSDKKRADFSAVTCWGIFEDRDGIDNLILLSAEKRRWEFPQLVDTARALYYEKTPDAVIVEKQGSGISLIQELRRQQVPVIAYDTGDKDKVARAHASVPLFNAGRVWVPDGYRFAEEVIYECSTFPRSEHDDYVDTVVQAVLWFRAGGWLTHPKDIVVPAKLGEGDVTYQRRRYYM